MATLKIKQANGDQAELHFRNGKGEKANGGMVMTVTGLHEDINQKIPISLEVFLTGTDRKAIRGILA